MSHGDHQSEPLYIAVIYMYVGDGLGARLESYRSHTQTLALYISYTVQVIAGLRSEATKFK